MHFSRFFVVLVLVVLLNGCVAPTAQPPAPRVNAKLTINGVTYDTPHPPYPYQARAKHHQGNSTIRVIFNAQGKVERVAFVQPTGFRELDGNTVNFILVNWHCTPGRRSMITVPIKYHLVN